MNKKFTDLILINPSVPLVKGRKYPFVEMASVSTTNRIPDHIDERMLSGGVRFQAGDTVIARIEPCLQNGKKFYCKDIVEGFGSTEFIVFRPKNGAVDNVFLYYYMQLHNVRERMIQSMTGATGRQRVNPDIFKDIFIDLPSIEVQKKIGCILSKFDDLIENNQKQMILLEETAHRLYKEWFVYLRFPGYKDVDIIDGVPTGWKRCTLEDVIDFNPKVTLNKARIKQCVPMSALSTSSMVLDETEFTLTASNSGSKFQNGDTLLARITPCLENGKTGFVDGIVSQEGAVGSTEFIVMRSKLLNPYMVYLLSRTEDFRETAIKSMTGSDGRQRAQVDKLKSYDYLLPPVNIVSSFSEIAEPVFSAISVCNKKCIRLAEARDRLLPKLMSGEIEL